MEPRPHERGKNSTALTLRWKCSSLQWSHVLTNVERAVKKVKGRVILGASMEPRPHERGKLILITTYIRRDQASMEPRPHERGKELLNNGERLPAEASMEPRPHERGKCRAAALKRAQSVASMEPRPHERGKIDLGKLGLFIAKCFNGATSSRTWKAFCRSASSARTRCFNGATSSRTWKVLGTQFRPAPECASMEPRPHERGKF